jgi:uncharacterized protein
LSPESKILRSYRRFSHKGAVYRIASTCYETVIENIKNLRSEIESYIELCPEFATTLIPISQTIDAPSIVQDMINAAAAAGVGPMAAVAGAIAQHAARAAYETDGKEVIIENGGDIFLYSDEEVAVSLYAGSSPLAHRLAFRIKSGELPLAVCSSSGAMGHSKSFGTADLVTVTGKNAALADAVATSLCNLVQSKTDIEKVLEKAESLAGINGVLIIKGDKLGMVGQLPELVRQEDPSADAKVTRS